MGFISVWLLELLLLLVSLPCENMLLNSVLPIAALLVQQVWAQAADHTSSYYAAGVPTDTPVSGNYTDYLRPRVHFSPPRYFMNGESASEIGIDRNVDTQTDPNGMHRDPSGIWHIYYQYNPLTPVAGNQVRELVQRFERTYGLTGLSIGDMPHRKIYTLGRTRRSPSGHRTTIL